MKNYIEEILNKENDWDRITKVIMAKGLIEKVAREEMLRARKTMEQGKAAGHSGICTMISASGGVGTSAMVKHCQCVLDGNEMADKWQTNVLVLIFKK